MKLSLVAIALIILSAGCSQQDQKVKNYTPRTLTKNEVFNDFPTNASDSISVLSNNQGKLETFSAKFRDSTVHIQAGAADQNKDATKFVSAQFINQQKTALLVQIADSSGMIPRPFLIAVKDGVLEVISLYRPSKGKEDLKFSKGVKKIGATGYLVNNDFFITNVTAKVYLVKRQNDEERIQGDVLLLSPDKQTIVFTAKNVLYQVNYRTDDVVSEPIVAGSPKGDEAAFNNWITTNYAFTKNKRGNTFLKYHDDNRIVDMKEFK
ncbi:hypothetical protein [Pedobacter cryoconitis]|uniref:Lipoprotein n=1 Tax=Pedobacter cryoconitis TaxID=188932 RepID=A0A327SAJ4_9SPHI|nr:hypothetical protein [Pedobacter cryoconitis]RAJ25372.1 hypothetical protein LY11_04107 [Pedobacter cryoconitis]